MKAIICLILCLFMLCSGCGLYQQELAQKRRKTYVESHTLTEPIKTAINNGQIMIGMTKADVQAS